MGVWGIHTKEKNWVQNDLSQWYEVMYQEEEECQGGGKPPRHILSVQLWCMNLVANPACKTWKLTIPWVTRRVMARKALNYHVICDSDPSLDGFGSLKMCRFWEMAFFIYLFYVWGYIWGMYGVCMGYGGMGKYMYGFPFHADILFFQRKWHLSLPIFF